MKIGILTFIDTINYGALFQAYALEEVLREMGNDVEIIRYINEIIEAREKSSNRYSIRGLLNSLIIGNGLKRKEEKFRDFESAFMKGTKKCDDKTISDVCKTFDKIITGSDQVWNLTLTGGDLHYFLDFVSDDTKKISYAPSFGETEIPQNIRDKVSRLLRGFKALSVREHSGLAKISQVSERKAEVVLDPTLLLTKAHWQKLLVSKLCKDPYILVYLPHKKDICFSFAKRLQAKTGYKIIYLSISPRIIKGVKTIYDASPQEWLSWIFYADYVVTGSFHGTAFSLNFEKQFFFENLGAGSRIDDLVRLTGTSERNLTSASMDDIIDYNLVKYKLQKNRTASMKWLKNAINKI